MTSSAAPGRAQYAAPSRRQTADACGKASRRRQRRLAETCRGRCFPRPASAFSLSALPLRRASLKGYTQRVHSKKTDFLRRFPHSLRLDQTPPGRFTVGSRWADNAFFARQIAASDPSCREELHEQTSNSIARCRSRSVRFRSSAAHAQDSSKARLSQSQPSARAARCRYRSSHDAGREGSVSSSIRLAQFRGSTFPPTTGGARRYTASSTTAPRSSPSPIGLAATFDRARHPQDG